MENIVIPTEHATAQRLSSEEIQVQSALFSKLPYMRHLADAVPDIFLVLNKYRQIVFGNQALLNLAGEKRPEAVYGLRPGEMLHCIHAEETAGGCGTTVFCRTCGAVSAVLLAIDGRKDIQECVITTRNGETLDFRACASPFKNGTEFAFFVLQDISHEKRRRALERIFFHDVLNTAGGVQGLAEILKEEDNPQEAGELIDMIQTGARSLLEEISAQKALSAAETGELAVEPETVRANDLLKEISALYENHAVSENRRIALHPVVQNFEFEADRTLLRRVLGNMTKNALEASSAGDTVTIGARMKDNRVELWVHNKGLMPMSSQLQVFQRSFSTKGKGRGLGTYSVKLLTERYLKGTVSFTSTEAEGTRFCLSLPAMNGAAS